MTRVSNPGIPNPRIPARFVNPGSQDCRRPNPGISGLAIFLLISTFHLQNDIFGIKKDLWLKGPIADSPCPTTIPQAGQGATGSARHDGHSHSHNPTTANRHLKNAIKAELALHDSTGRRGSALQTVYSHLLTVSPTSVEAERAFSVAGTFTTKLRSRLGDTSIDSLCFLRAFYLRDKPK